MEGDEMPKHAGKCHIVLEGIRSLFGTAEIHSKLENSRNIPVPQQFVHVTDIFLMYYIQMGAIICYLLQKYFYEI